MSVTAAGTPSRQQGGWSWLWNRELESYPDTGNRMLYLGITVLATVMLYYQLYVGGSVSTLFLQELHMSFPFFVYALAVGNLIGAFGSLFAGLTDRWGRTNIVVIGLFVTAIFTLVVIPQSPNKWFFIIASFVVAFVEGICLVATPALIRDFSPQVGRATAMGFWTSGPVVGSLIVSVVGAHAIAANASPSDWTKAYYICGVAGVVVAIVALLGLRELSPGLRDQLMVSMHDRALVEARAKGIDIEESLRNPWGQLIKPDVVISALGISVFLLVYYTAVGFGLIYFTTVFAFSVRDGNGLGNWTWGFNVISVLLFGYISDAARVRKPFMLIGGITSAIMLVLYLERAGHPTGYYHLAVLVGILSFCLGIAYVPWMASFTETVEYRNPALTATGLAIWGWILRVVVFVSYLIIPAVITSVTPLVSYGTAAQTAAAKYPSQLAFVTAHPTQAAQAQALAPELAAVAAHPALFAALAANPNSLALQAQALRAVGPTTLASIAANKATIASLIPFATQLSALSTAAKDPDFQILLKHGTSVTNAKKNAPHEWQTWYWICFGGMIFFLFTVPLMRGEWSPRKAKEAEDAHEALIQSEMAKLGMTS
jgi:MFS family permease